jgi:hypothetical protein
MVLSFGTVKSFGAHTRTKDVRRRRDEIEWKVPMQRKKKTRAKVKLGILIESCCIEQN